MINVVTVSFRDYTVDGRLIKERSFDTLPEMLGSDLRDLLSEDGTWGAKEFYTSLGYMSKDEEIKDVWRTNIMVRNSKGHLIAWSHLL